MQPTSLEAYDKVKKSLGKKQRDVFYVIAEFDPRTNSEIAQRLGWSINCVTGRTNELCKKDPPLVVKDRTRKCSITGRTAIAWRVKRADEIKEHQMEMEM